MTDAYFAHQNALRVLAEAQAAADQTQAQYEALGAQLDAAYQMISEALGGWVLPGPLTH